MRAWVMLVGALAGCGRIAFDPLGAGGELEISPRVARSNLNSVTRFTAIGGAPPFTFSAGDAELRVDPTGAFRAPSFPGNTTITVTDALGNSDTAEISFGGDFVYAMGGYDTSSIDNVWRSADGVTWNVVGQLPAGRLAGHLVVYDDALFFWGGSERVGGPYYNQVWRSSDAITWTQIGTLPTVMNAAGHAVFADRIWVTAGENGPLGYYDECWSSADGITWRAEAPFPIQFHGNELVPFAGRLWSFAGHEDPAQSDLVYSTADGVTWTSHPPVPAPGEYHAATVFRGRVWIAGGLGLLDRVVSSADGEVWQDSTRMSVGKLYLRIVELGGELWITGGQPPQTMHSADGVAWTQAPAFPAALEGSRLVLFTPGL